MKVRIIWHPNGKRKQKTFNNPKEALEFYRNNMKEIRRSPPLYFQFFIKGRWITESGYSPIGTLENWIKRQKT